VGISANSAFSAEWSGALTYFYSYPEDSERGGTILNAERGGTLISSERGGTVSKLKV